MIYCVEDERNIRELVIYTLNGGGFEAKGFENGAAMEEALAEEMPELILLDIMLPGENGMDILKKLKSSERTRDIPVIMVTAKVPNTIRSSAWTAERTTILSNPSA